MTTNADHLTTQALLSQLIDKTPPKIVWGLYALAISDRQTEAEFKVIRDVADGRDKRLLDRLLRFSFVREVEDEVRDEPVYIILHTEREILRRRLIKENPAAFLDAHRRILNYTIEHPHPIQVVQDQNRIFHRLIVDGEAGVRELETTFFAYTDERRLAAAERLVSSARYAATYVDLLNLPHETMLGQWNHYLTARLHQYHGEWRKASQQLAILINQPALDAQLRPNLQRAYGRVLAHSGDYVGAIQRYDKALHDFRARDDAEAQLAHTMLALGDANVGLASASRSFRQFRVRNREGWIEKLRGWLHIPAIPLLVYVAFKFGWRFVRPRSWPALRAQDWIIASLFEKAAEWYRDADSLLEQLDDRHNHVIADEKLANLFMTMGDSYEAAPVFERLLAETEAPLTNYRRARAQIGYAQTLFNLERPEAAIVQLREALPVVEAYEDKELIAQGNLLMAESLSAEQPVDVSAEQIESFYVTSLTNFKAVDDIIGMTEADERLPDLNPIELDVRRYMVRYQHPALLFFERIALFATATFLFLLPLLTTQLNSISLLEPNITSFIAPPIELETLDPVSFAGRSLTPDIAFEQDLSVDLAIISTVAPGTPIWIGVALVIAYIIAFSITGISILQRIKLKDVQDAQREAVELSNLGVQSGGNSIAWPDVTKVTEAQVTLLGIMLDGSSGAWVESDTTRVYISGKTGFYKQVMARIRHNTPQATHVDLDNHISWQRMGILFVIGGIILFAYWLLSQINPTFLNQTRFLNSPYTLATIHPYVMLMLFIPLLWWNVIRPIQVRIMLHSMRVSHWWTLIMTIVVALARMATNPDAWFTVPDIYPTLMLMTYAGSAVLLFLAQRNFNEKGKPTTAIVPLSTRILIVGAGIIFLTGSGVLLGQQVAAYHLLNQGDRLRDRAVQASDADKEALWESAIRRYSWASQFQSEAFTNNFFNFGIPPRQATVDIGAHTNRGLAWAQLENYNNAISDLTYVVEHTKNPTDYANRALLYQTLATQQEDSTAIETRDKAIADFSVAIEAAEASGVTGRSLGNLYFWRAATRYIDNQFDESIADFTAAIEANPQLTKAYLGRGWTQVAQANSNETPPAAAPDLYHLAIADFKTTLGQDANLVGAWHGLGYASYQLEQYEEAIQAWDKAIARATLDHEEAQLVVSRGAAHWAALNGVDVCAANRNSDDPTAVAWTAAAQAHLEQSSADLLRGSELLPNNRTLHRMRGQVNWLRRHCHPDGFVAALQESVGAYDDALALGDNGLDLQRHARLNYALYIRVQESDSDAATAYLDIAKESIARALELEPNNAGFKTVYTDIWGSALDQQQSLETLLGTYASAEALIELLGDYAALEIEHATSSAMADSAARSLSDVLASTAQIAPADFIAAIELSSAELVANADTLAGDASYYWKRARFYFTLGQSLFDRYPESLDNVEHAAQLASESIGRAAELDNDACNSGCSIWVDFMNEGLVGWYHLRRGDDAAAAGELETALNDYSIAADTIGYANAFNINDSIDASFKKALTMLELGRYDEGVNAYEQALSLADEYNNNSFEMIIKQIEALITP